MQQRESRGEPRRDADGSILPDQGEINGFPVTYENGRFIIWPPHYAQEQGDTTPMATRGSWANAVGYIREIAPPRRLTRPGGTDDAPER